MDNALRRIFIPALIATLLSATPLIGFGSTRSVVSLLEMRKKNVVLQEWDLSCGAAALTTILRYQHGIDTTEKEVATALIQRKEYIENPDLLKYKQGFSLLDLKRHVERLGLKGEGFGRLELDNLIEQAPVIIPVRLQDYNHFVIFRALAGNRVLVADPAWGNRILSKSEFAKAWIDFGDLGKIGFVVRSDDTDPGLNKLLPSALDFVMLR